MMELEKLAERCEQATGPDQSLNAGIVLALGGERKGHFWWIGERLLGTSPPAYTASLDAAMTLWPGEVPHLIPSDPRICSAMALRARAALHDREDI